MLEDFEARFRRKFPSGEPSQEQIEEWSHSLPRHLFEPGSVAHATAEQNDKRQVVDPGVNPFKDWQKPGFNLTRASRLVKENPALAKRYAAEAGFPLE